jgi:phosphatidyl-myo-inositol alpha-mannosyltransferase
MKVAFVLDDSLDRPDGVQQYVLTLGTFLSERGHEVHYLCSGTTRTDVPNVHSLARNAATQFNGNALRIPLPTSRRLLREFLARERFDVIHVQTPHSPLFAGRVVTQARKLQGSSVEIVGSFLILPTGAISRLATRVLGLILRRNLRRFDRFCAISPAAAEFARASFHVPCGMIPAAVDVKRIAKAAHPQRGRTDRVVVSFLGRLVERKGALELVEALGLIRSEVRDHMEVRLAGRGPLAEEIRRRVDLLGLSELVSMPGFVSEEDKPTFLAEADVAVFPATGGESFGIILVEAMAAGAGAVIGGDNPGYRSVLGDSPNVVVDPHDSVAFAALLSRLVTEPALRHSIGVDQKERLRAFDIEVTGPAIEAFYRG